MVNTPAATLIQLARERDRKKEAFEEAVDLYEEARLGKNYYRISYLIGTDPAIED